MKTNLHFDLNSAFVNGLVFGFDMGLGSIGYAVRRGKKFLATGVIVCPRSASDLSKRRILRRSRRTLRSRKYRHRWLIQELEKIGLTRPKDNPHDPVALRAKAIKGTVLSGEELHAAIAHLWRRRGHAEVPWANRDVNDEHHKEEAVIQEGISKLLDEMKITGCQFPCEFLVRYPTKQRRRIWPRDLLKAEFDAIVASQQSAYPKLAEKADWLLYGDTRAVKNHHVYFKSTEGRNPGVLGLRWPRFDNRSPALDLWQPHDAKGRPLHVVRKNKEAFASAQWELALMNFRVLDAQTLQKRDPNVDFPNFVAALRKEWDKNGKGVSLVRLKKMAEPYSSRFLLGKDQRALVPDHGSGRSRFSTQTLELLRQEIGAGRRVDPPPPVLHRRGENWERALDRYLAKTNNPLLQYRLVLFRGLLNQLTKKYGQPHMVIVQADRILGLSPKAKYVLNKRNETFRKQREIASTALKAAEQTDSTDAVQKYRLWREARGRCPLCLEAITLATLFSGEVDIEPLVPRARVYCNAFYNLIVGHTRCNRDVKRDRTPFEAFSSSPLWEDIKKNAAECFTGGKLEIFLSPNAEQLIEQRADLAHTSYVAKCLRHICLIRLGWLGEDGREPDDADNTTSNRFQISNGQITSRLRQSWGLDRILYDGPTKDNGEAWSQFAEKNRGDLRHHVLNAMTVSCTLPWQARHTRSATDEFGNHGWWLHDKNGCSRASNPIGLNRARAKIVIKKAVVRQHVSRSNHRQTFGTTLYAKKAKDTYVARKLFTTLKPKNLGSIYPEEFSRYCKLAWERYRTESPNIGVELEKNNGSLPESFVAKLCFAHFQQWRANKPPHFVWPDGVKIPIRNVRLICIKNDAGAIFSNSGTNAYVKRTGFREVRIHVSEDGKTLIPVFVPRWRRDHPFSHNPIVSNSTPVAVFRRGDVVTLHKPSAAGTPVGQYRIISTQQKSLRLVPLHIRDDPHVLKAFGIKSDRVEIRWPEFLHAIESRLRSAKRNL